MTDISSTGEPLGMSEFWIPEFESTTSYSKRITTQLLGEDHMLVAGSVGNASTDSVMGRIFTYTIEEDSFEDVFNYGELESDNTQFYCSDLTSDSSLYVGSLVQINGDYQVRILKLDSEFLLEWETVDLGCGAFCRYFPEQVMELENGNIAVLLTDFLF